MSSQQNHEPRLTDPHAAPAVLPAMLALQQVVNQSELEPSLKELVKLRASQINGCAFCIDMHFRDAKKRGEPDNRLYLLDAWREVNIYSDRESAALAWTEALTRLSDDAISDELFAMVLRLMAAECPFFASMMRALWCTRAPRSTSEPLPVRES